MFSLFKSNPADKLRKKRKKLLEEAMHIPHSGDLKLHATNMEDRDDARVTFIHRTLQKMNADIRDKHSGIYCVHGEPLETWKLLTETFDVRKVYYNRDYEPYARQRDETVNQFLSDKGIEVHTFKDHVIHEPDEVLKDDGNPYVVYTPYSRKWREKLSDSDLETHPSALYFNNFLNLDEFPLPGLSEMGFKPSSIDIPADEVADSLLRQYEDRRNFPAMEGTSRLGIHLRFGTISIRKIAARARELSDTFLNELIWREFYQMILFHFPDVVTQNFHRKYDAVKWRNNKEEFQRWCDGQTGYPIVDAGMRQLNKTGFMHNRVRMIVASFLTKHLLIDWRWGEAYFARKLLD